MLDFKLCRSEPINMLTPEQKKSQDRRLELEQRVWDSQREILTIGSNCVDHEIIRGRLIFSPAKNKVVNTHDGLPENWNDGCFSVSCSICGKDFGWHCPVNPKQYCEYNYKVNGENCIHCGIPEERK